MKNDKKSFLILIIKIRKSMYIYAQQNHTPFYISIKNFIFNINHQIFRIILIKLLTYNSMNLNNLRINFKYQF